MKRNEKLHDGPSESTLAQYEAEEAARKASRLTGPTKLAEFLLTGSSYRELVHEAVKLKDAIALELYHENYVTMALIEVSPADRAAFHRVIEIANRLRLAR